MKKAIIFSVGFAGRAIYRKAKDEYQIIGFIDSNKEISGSKYEGITIYCVDEINNLDFDVILFGGIWYEEMEKQLLSLGIDKNKIILVPESEIPYSTNKREEATDEAIKKLDIFFNSKNIKYIVYGSSLITILRKKSLSCVTDVDLILADYKNLEFLANNLANSFPEYNISIKYFEKDTFTRKKGDIRQIVINDNSDEKISFDIISMFTCGNFLVHTYVNKFIYYPKHMFDNIIRYPYKDFDLPIPKHYDEILTALYGKDYIIPPKKWSNNDYGNIITKEELEKLVNKK
ncbi:hypothetical protein [Campylobacter magnus]|uniref:hypothetical protein n=1 Tax=Campylobacter magnus TaxID=3026462 RepID=UPI002361D7CC|nr:hypothetical protein [Campylobacter magnus]MDD0855203.1 hypothetical protein [Campylobacter magnus]